MESGGEAGRVNISEDTKNLLESQEAFNDKSKYNEYKRKVKDTTKYKFSFNKVINVSSVNREINSYYIERYSNNNQQHSINSD